MCNGIYGYDTNPRALVLRQQKVSCGAAASASLWNRDCSTVLPRFPGPAGSIGPATAAWASRFPPTVAPSTAACFAFACKKCTQNDGSTGRSLKRSENDKIATVRQMHKTELPTCNQDLLDELQCSENMTSCMALLKTVKLEAPTTNSRRHMLCTAEHFEQATYP